LSKYLTYQLTQNGSFWGCSSQTISWLALKKVKNQEKQNTKPTTTTTTTTTTATATATTTTIISQLSGARFTKYLTIYRKIILTLGYSKLKLHIAIHAKDFS